MLSRLFFGVFAGALTFCAFLEIGVLRADLLTEAVRIFLVAGSSVSSIDLRFG
jgi:hypothetical protein